MSTAQNLFQARELALSRGGRRLLSDLSFALAPGGALLLEGPNGCGKTSLLRALAGLCPLTHGSLLWEGHLIAKDPAAYRARLHFVGHQDGVKPLLSARANLHLWCDLAGSAKREDLDRALGAFNLQALSALRGRRLSAGQKRRLALARLIARSAPLWLLDEPATALDREALGVLGGLIAAHRKAGGLVIAASHGGLDLPGAEALDLAAHQARSSEAYLW